MTRKWDDPPDPLTSARVEMLLVEMNDGNEWMSVDGDGDLSLKIGEYRELLRCWQQVHAANAAKVRTPCP